MKKGKNIDDGRPGTASGIRKAYSTTPGKRPATFEATEERRGSSWDRRDREKKRSGRELRLSKTNVTTGDTNAREKLARRARRQGKSV